MGYTAERAGMALSPGALVLIVMMPIAGKLVTKMDARLLVSIGYFVTAAGLYNLTRLDLDVNFGTIVLVALAAGDGAVVRLYPHQHAELCGRAAR